MYTPPPPKRPKVTYFSQGSQQEGPSQDLIISLAQITTLLTPRTPSSQQSSQSSPSQSSPSQSSPATPNLLLNLQTSSNGLQSGSKEWAVCVIVLFSIHCFFKAEVDLKYQQRIANLRQSIEFKKKTIKDTERTLNQLRKDLYIDKLELETCTAMVRSQSFCQI